MIRKLGDPVLRGVAEETEITQETVTLVNKMKFVLWKSGGVGLAAPQIGVPKRIFLYDIEAKNKGKAIINPTLFEYSDELWGWEEGCLSVPGFTFPVYRSKRVLLKGYDLDGMEVSLEADDLLARIFQHEIDHLNGKLVIDHLSEDEIKEFTLSWQKMKLQKKKKRK